MFDSKARIEFLTFHWLEVTMYQMHGQTYKVLKPGIGTLYKVKVLDFRRAM